MNNLPQSYLDVVVRIDGLKSEYIRYMYPDKSWSHNSKVISWRPLLSKELVDIACDKMIRAGGECICLVCNQEYKRHSENIDVLYYYSNFYLYNICNGLLVKL